MNTGNQIVDRTLERAAAKWRGLLFLQRTGTIGASVCLIFLLLSAAMLAGWWTEPFAAYLVIIGALVIGVILWLVAGLVVCAETPDRRWLSRVLERGQPKLLDRVNTLVALESKRGRPEVTPFYQRIARQAQQILFETPPNIRLASTRPIAHFATFVVLLVATVFVYDKFSPWQRMLDARQAKLSALVPKPHDPPPPPGLELAQSSDVTRQKQAWAEVRITEPARDLQMTKVDVVPLQIEAAANEPLQKISWTSAVNGKAEQAHDLPAPADPRFAVFQPTLYLDELKLSDWDVLSYYAKADTRKTNSVASEIYFIEVRPFREDIFKMPGGEGGKAMRCINELSALIGQQQHVIRQTHQHTQSPPESNTGRDQDRKKLADAEIDLGQATEHLYARMADELENKPIGDALDHLAKAGKSLGSAAQTIRENLLPQAQEHERGALADLVATRKAFQKSVSEHPGDFEEKTLEAPPTVADSKDKLKEMAEFRDEAKAAADFMRKLIEQQQNVASSANRTTPSAGTNVYPRLAEQEKKIEASLKDFREQHPQVFKPVQPEASSAEKSLESARQSLESKNPQAPSQVREATRKMQNLSQAMKEKSAERQLADAYKLKKEIERQVQNFSRCQNPGSGGGLSDAEVKRAVADTRKALKQLKSVANQSPTSEAFGPALRESLSDVNMTSMNWPLGELEQAATPEARKKPAGAVKESLEKVSEAFEQSQPQAMQMAEKAAQKGQSADFDRGLAQLSSLVHQLENKRPSAPADQAKLGQEALYNLQRSLPEKGGSNERGNQILRPLEAELKKGEAPVDVEILKSVLASLQAYSVELSAKKEAKPEKPEITGLDPNRLPPAYRGRIEKYFQKLSEK